MNTVLKVLFSMSFSGSLLILVLFAGKRLLKNKLSRQWQYYIWLIVIVRLLLPFEPKFNLMEKVYQTINPAIMQIGLLPQPQNLYNSSDTSNVLTINIEPNNPSTDNLSETLTATNFIKSIVFLLENDIWLIWLTIVLLLLTRKITIYQSFIRYIKAGLNPVSNMEHLDQLSIIAKQVGIKKPIELCINPLISSPLLIGFFHPYIVLPSTDISEKDFQYIILHELIHNKRQDIYYKWLVQVTVCLHWFNPLVYFMNREITKACEFSCDEAVLVKMGYDSAKDYGKTLLDAMAAIGKYKESFGVMTLSENKQLLKERLEAIMSFKKKSKTIQFLTAILTLCISFGASFVGVCPVMAKTYSNSAKENKSFETEEIENEKKQIFLTQAERYYKDSLPLFEIAFFRMDEETQSTWLDKIYADGEIAFFSVSVDQLKKDSPLIQLFAEKTYIDRSISFFSVLTDCMSEEMLELWLDRALEDKQVSFQSVLFNKLDWKDELNELETKLEEQQQKEYQLYDIIHNGKTYYYKNQLVYIFLDIRQDSSFYTLDINPQGEVNIKITRNKNGEIESVNYMTEEEVEELLEGMEDSDD